MHARSLLSAVLAAALLRGLCHADAGGPRSSQASVFAVRGKVMMRAPAQAGFQQISMALAQPGSEIATEADAQASIQFADGSHLVLWPDTLVKIAGDKRLELARGRVRAHFVKRLLQRPWTLTTPAQPAWVLGDRFTLRVQQSGSAAGEPHWAPWPNAAKARLVSVSGEMELLQGPKSWRPSALWLPLQLEPGSVVATYGTGGATLSLDEGSRVRLGENAALALDAEHATLLGGSIEVRSEPGKPVQFITPGLPAAIAGSFTAEILPVDADQRRSWLGSLYGAPAPSAPARAWKTGGAPSAVSATED